MRQHLALGETRSPVDLHLAFPAGHAISATHKTSSAVRGGRARHRNGALSSVRDASYARALFSVELDLSIPVTCAALPCYSRGVSLFCWNDADMGSRIPSKKCVNEAQLQIMLDRRQAQRDQMQQVATAGVKSN